MRGSALPANRLGDASGLLLREALGDGAPQSARLLGGDASPQGDRGAGSLGVSMRFGPKPAGETFAKATTPRTVVETQPIVMDAYVPGQNSGPGGDGGGEGE